MKRFFKLITVVVLFIFVVCNKKCFCEEFLLDDVIVTLPEHLTDKIGISGLIVDLKYDGKNLKVLEFGNLISSSVESHERIYPKGLVFKRFYNYLKSFNLAVWFTGYKNKNIETLRELGCSVIFKGADLRKNHTFCKLAFSREDKKYLKIEDHKIILMSNVHRYVKEVFKNLKKDFKGFLTLNNVAYGYGVNKKKAAMLFDDDLLAHYKPQWKSYKKQFSEELVEKIKKDFDSDILVIKPIDSCWGKGIIMVNKDNLGKTLKTIFTNKFYAAGTSDAYSYWARDRNNEFLVESFEVSKLAIVDGKKYDPKMRVCFVLSCGGGVVNLRFLGSYWLCPLKSITDDCSLTEKHKASHGWEGGALKVSDQDAKQVQEILGYVLPKVYIKMLERS